ncbi:phosphate ABC transporter ATP-binding protein [Haladaptatus sp. DJG-WS-42]|uniref:amino acid ABC transporter ATP-binding protein n=1 Tax=Haladaptatus sp. DJG-WS-42 TaxID=3120516 RepID=UPI0030CE8DC2
MIQARALSHGFNGTDVLSAVSLDVSAGEVLAIVGPSGTGKTTLLRLLALFDPPQAGDVLVDGDDVWSLSREERLARRRRIGMVFQDRSLFSTTVAKNAAYGLDVRQPWPTRLKHMLTRERAPSAVLDALDTVGMRDKMSQHARGLSAGEAQRVAFARALAVEPDVLLLDEPTSNLDPRNTALLEEAVTRARDRGIGVVIATHDMQQARRVSDRTAVLLAGECIEYGATERVFERPHDERARKFITGELVY